MQIKNIKRNGEIISRIYWMEVEGEETEVKNESTKLGEDEELEEDKEDIKKNEA